MANRRSGAIPTHTKTALVLQGGGALGAYQAGVYEQLLSTPYKPNWVAGVSIGAINSAIIVGNPPESRIERLREFWNLVSSGVSYPAPHFEEQRAAFNQFSAMVAATVGVPGFYRPRNVPALLEPPGSHQALSVYDTSALRETLTRLVDFDLINSKQIRLSVGSVNVTTGNSTYFDNFEREIGPEHIMASGALPPAFAPVLIDGQAYWDGGIVSNTPLQYVLDNRGGDDLLALQVDLFSARGPMPKDLGSVLSRQKDIQYSSRTRYNTDMAAKIQNTRQAARDLLMNLPPKVRNDPGVVELRKLLVTPRADIVHLIYRQKPYEHESRDYEFSRASVLEHWHAGMRDLKDTVTHPEWLRRTGLDDGVVTYDLTRPRD
ncbi:MAG: patatin-like phospholipase family protein [Burkholderiaceae bacterium]